MRTFFLPDLEKAALEHYPIVSSLSLKGNQDKWHNRREGLIIKAALFDGFTWWEDYKVEVIASRLLPQFLIEAVEQHACRIDDGDGNIIYGSYSRDYRLPMERYVPFSRLLQKEGLDVQFSSMNATEKIGTVLQVLSAYIGEKDAALFVEDMCLADYIIGNVDRHTGNYGLLIRRDTDDNVVNIRPAPLYDFGMGMFQGQKVGKGDDLVKAVQNMLKSPFAIDLHGAYAHYQDSWRKRWGGMTVKLSGLDFPEGLGKLYLANALASLDIGMEEV